MALLATNESYNASLQVAFIWSRLRKTLLPNHMVKVNKPACVSEPEKKNAVSLWDSNSFISQYCIQDDVVEVVVACAALRTRALECPNHS